MTRWKKSLGFMVAAEFTVAAHVLLFLPPKAQAATPVPVEAKVSGEAALAMLKIAEPVPQEPVTVNKTVPNVEPPPQYPTFSPIPTDEELFKARVFGEPLIPENGETNDSENQALAQAITTYLYGGDSEALEPLEGVVTAFPQSRWRVAVQANVGSWYRKKGYFTRAQRNLTEAWQLGKNSDTEGVRRLAEFAAGELMQIHMQFGQVDPLEALVTDFEGRELSGGITERLASARATVWGLRNDHASAIPSGSVALERIRKNKHDKAEKEKKDKDPKYKKKPSKRHAELDAFPATHDGASLAEIQDLADLTNLNLQMAKRQDPAAATPVPSLVHLKEGHFAALVEVRDGRFKFDDPLLGGEVWMSRQAFDEETSRFFLVEQGRLPDGFRSASRGETEPIRGKCVYATGDDDDTGEEDEQETEDENAYGSGHNWPGENEGDGDGKSGCGLCTYSFHSMLASLHIFDRPLGYRPPLGPSVYFKVTYNHREASQPTTFTFSNLGARWTFGWLSYIEDDPGNVGAPVEHYQRGGGRETYEGFANGSSEPHEEVRAIMKIISTNPIVYERHLANGSVEVFSESDGAATAPRRIFMTQVKDSAGNALSFTYDAQLRLVSATDALGQVTTVSYELATDPLKVTKVTDPFERAAYFEYDDLGRLVKITDVIGMTSELEYGGSDFVRALVTLYGRTTFRHGGGPHNSLTNRWLEATDPLGGTHRVEHLLNSAPVASTDSANEVPTGFSGNSGLDTHVSVYYSKLAMDRTTADPPDPTKGKIIRWRSSSTFKMSGYHKQSVKRTLENRVWFEHAGETITNGVGPTGRPVMVGRVLDDGTSQIRRYEHNAVGKLIRYVDPAGREMNFVNGHGNVADSDPATGTGINLLEVKHNNGPAFETLATLTYNSERRPLTLTHALGDSRSYTYNAEGQLLTATTPATTEAPAGATTTLTYDNDGYLQSVTGQVPGSTGSYTYDAFGRVKTLTPPSEDAVTFAYDNLNRFTRVTYGDSTYEEVVYSRLDPGRLRDRLGRWSHTTFDAMGRPVASVDPAGRTTSLQWCRCGALEALIDANGNRTSWDRDDQGRVVTETRANGSEYDYTYESTTSRLKTLTDPRAIMTTFEYFLDGRLKKKSYSDATPDATYTYDYRGRPATATNGTDTLSWTYDLKGRLLSESSTKNSSTVSYTYDQVGNRRTLSLDGTPFGTYGYDSALRLKSITRASDVFEFTYDVASRRIGMLYPNGISTTYEYNSESRLQRITATLEATIVTDFQYTYNAVGNRTEKQTPDFTETYEYDRADQVIEAVRTGTAANRWHYAYDPAGNRTTEQIGNGPVHTSHDNMNRLLSTDAGGALTFKGTLDEPATVTVEAESADVDSSNTFHGSVESSSGTNTVVVVATDPSSNSRTNTYEVAVSGTTTSYSHDPNGNVTEKDDGTDTWTYEWNAENQLTEVLKNETSLATFAYDALGRRVEKVSGATTITYTYDGVDILRQAQGALPTYYVHGPGVDEPLAKEVSGSASYYHADGLGSVQKISDTDGEVIHEYRYDAFGRIEAGESEGGYAFTAREWDPEIGLFYFRSRYYDATTGRFTTEDPIGLVAGTNLYRYVKNNPLRFVDPFGAEEKNPNSPVDAAAKFFEEHYPTTEITGNEVCAQICESTGPGEKEYVTTAPRMGNDSNCPATSQSEHASCPDGFAPFGRCHTHPTNPDWAPELNDNFSPGDLSNASADKIESFLGNEKGKILGYNGKTGEEPSVVGSFKR